MTEVPIYALRGWHHADCGERMEFINRAGELRVEARCPEHPGHAEYQITRDP